MNKKTLLTQDGFNKLEEELRYLKAEKRMEVAERIKDALTFGDISENSEYTDAKDEQDMLNKRIKDIERKLRDVEIIADTVAGSDIVAIGNTVRVYIEEWDEEHSFRIVGSTEVDPFNDIISDESPLGSALIGTTVGDKVLVEAPDLQYTALVKEIIA